jgi:hypothetical protein
MTDTRVGFGRRFPIHGLHICADMLDVSQSHLDIAQQYLTDHDTNG